MAAGPYTDIEVMLHEMNELLNKRNLRPIFQRPIDNNKGIRITGKFKTKHPTVPSPMCYMTVGRQSTGATVHDGMGLAWRTGYAVSGTYNLYLVDNNYLSDNTPIRTNNMIYEENLNNFLAYGRSNIEPDEWYNFGIQIDSTWGVRVCVYSGSLAGSPDYSNAYSVSNPSGYVMSMGARYEGYEPQANGTDFGIGILDTEQADWLFDDLRIATIVEGHPAALYKLHAPNTTYPDDTGARLYLKGTAQDGLGNYGLTWYLWNNGSSEWEDIGSNTTSTVTGVIYNIDAINNYRDVDGYMHVMGMGNNAGVEGVLNTDYVKLSTPIPSGIHAGHMTDIYVHAPTRILRDTKSISAVGYAVDLSTCFHPICEIEEVYSDDAGENLVRDSAVAEERYTIVNTAPNYTYSTQENYYISIGTIATDLIDVTYTYFADGELIQAFLDSDDNRIPTCSNLLKISPPASITINTLEYRGSIEASDLQTKIARWINDLVRESFEVTDLIAYLYTLGVTYVNLSSLDITVTLYDMAGNVVETAEITSSYAIEAPNTFFTDVVKLAGVVKI